MDGRLCVDIATGVEAYRLLGEWTKLHVTIHPLARRCIQAIRPHDPTHEQLHQLFEC